MLPTIYIWVIVGGVLFVIVRYVQKKNTENTYTLPHAVRDFLFGSILVSILQFGLQQSELTPSSSTTTLSNTIDDSMDVLVAPPPLY